MALTPDKLMRVMTFVESEESRLCETKKLFTINEGKLLPFVIDALRNELSPSAFERAVKRVAPINIFKKMVDKLSGLYSKEVVRKTDNEDADVNQEIVDWYVKTMCMDNKMVSSQKQFNVNKYTALEPYLDTENDEAIPKLRTLPAHTFLVYSDSKLDPTNPTAFIKILGNFDKDTGEMDENKNKMYKTVTVYMIYDKDNIVAIDSDKEIRSDFMKGNEDMINPFGTIPFIYVNNSEYMLMPLLEQGNFEMSTLIPLLLTDLNYATQFQSHSIIYAIDADISNLSGNPDAVWHVKSDEKPDGDPSSTASIGTIKPEVEIDKVLKLIETETRMWLDTQNIKGASIGNLEVEQAASGIAKMIDEGDTTAAREEQESLYQKVEQDFWRLISVMHNHWIDDNENLEEKRKVIDRLNVTTTFEEQRVIVDEEKRLREITMKKDAGLTSHRRALVDANPSLSEGEITELMIEIRQERLDDLSFSVPEKDSTDLDEDNQDGDTAEDSDQDTKNS